MHQEKFPEARLPHYSTEHLLRWWENTWKNTTHVFGDAVYIFQLCSLCCDSLGLPAIVSPPFYFSLWDVSRFGW